MAADDYAKFNKLHPLVSYLPGMHAEYTAGDTLGRELSELVHELRAPLLDARLGDGERDEGRV